jgi:hypothetical protein
VFQTPMKNGQAVVMANFLVISSLAVGIVALPGVIAMPVFAQTPQAKTSRAASGKPNLNGIWQALNTANWDIRTHGASAGPVPSLAAEFAIAPGMGVVDGDVIPYLPEAAVKQKQNFQNRLTLDPEIKCYLPGVPRATYMPYPFQIVQSSKTIMMVYEYAGAVRTINMDSAAAAPVDSWMGWSNGHWDGDSLVVDVTGQNDQTWFDRAGNFHSEALHVIERYTPRTPETLMYEATIEDPKVFSRSWKISMPLYKHVEKSARLLDYKCVEFAEELLYGPYRKKPTN